MSLTGWLLDAYPVREGMRVWVIGDDGKRMSGIERWTPVAYVDKRSDADRIGRWLSAQGVTAEIAVDHKIELMSGVRREVQALRVADAMRFPALMSRALREFPEVPFYNADLLPERVWFWSTGRFPLARITAELCDGIWTSLTCLDSVWDLDWAMPPLAVLGLRLEGPPLNPAHDGWGGGSRSLEVHLSSMPGEEPEVRVLEGSDPVGLLSRLAGIMRDLDPDVILTEYGDAWLMPALDALSRKHAMPLPWCRDLTRPPKTTKSRSYFTYGQIVHRDGAWLLSGRLHFDRRNSFALGTSGLAGLFETARLGGLPLQTAARTSVGTAISSMQVAQAMKEGVLVPVDKRETEDFKTAEELLETDRGGLIFLPDPGVFEGVGEFDFASMYPTIMVTKNLSQETMNCACCAGDPLAKVPETSLWSCRKRQGLIPRVLAPLIAKRMAAKKRKAEHPDPVVRARAAEISSAHKWMLVCCFGYLGYKNARFGRIEAHEATNAWGREALLLAKETAEGMGYRMLHAIVDSLWVVRSDGVRATKEEHQALCSAIEAATSLPVSYEGRYRWIAFLPSRADPRRTVAQRYVGAFETGETKIRGVELRRVDAPPFVAALQRELIDRLAQAAGAAEAVAASDDLAERVGEVLAEVRAGRMRAADLVVWRHLSRAPDTYRHATPVSVAAHQLISRGVRLEAGEKIGIVMGEARPYALQVLPDGEPYDVDFYETQAVKAAAAVLGPFGWPEARLRERYGAPPRRPAPVNPQLEFVFG